MLIKIFYLKYFKISLVSFLSLAFIYPKMVVLMTAKQISRGDPDNLASSINYLFLAISILVYISI